MDAKGKIEMLGEMLEFAEHALELRLRKEQPDITSEEVARRVADWFRKRPGAEYGDCAGSVRKRPFE